MQNWLCKMARPLVRHIIQARGSGLAALLQHRPVAALVRRKNNSLPCRSFASSHAEDWRSRGAWGGDDNTKQQFGQFADEYDAQRPGYPATMFARIKQLLQCDANSSRLSNPPRVLDVASGTGRLALEFANFGWQVISSDSDPKMLEIVRKKEGNIAVLECAAEDIPLDDNSVDLLTAAQSFHWFDADKALVEFHRVLRPKGLFVAAWNDRDLTQPWIADMEGVIESFNSKYSRELKQSDHWERTLTSGGLFAFDSDRSLETFHHCTTVSIPQVVQLCHTFSYVQNTLTEEQLADFDTELISVLQSYTDDGEQLSLHYVAKAYILRAL